MLAPQSPTPSNIQADVADACREIGCKTYRYHKNGRNEKFHHLLVCNSDVPGATRLDPSWGNDALIYGTKEKLLRETKQEAASLSALVIPRSPWK